MSEQLLLDKNKIRQTVLKQRRAMSASWKTQAELQMLKLLQSWDVFSNAGSVHIFISKSDEPDTSPIIEFGWKSGKQIGVPCVLPDTP